MRLIIAARTYFCSQTVGNGKFVISENPEIYVCNGLMEAKRREATNCNREPIEHRI